MSERRANFPCRQMNSEKIKGAALCYLSPIVVDKCSLVSCKCTCNIDAGPTERIERGVQDARRLRQGVARFVFKVN